MGRKYIRKLGSRSYGNFCSDQVEAALKDIIDNNMSLRAAAKKQTFIRHFVQ